MIWIALGFLGNGLAQFFQKYLHICGLGGYQAYALMLMYGAGLLFTLALFVINRGKISSGAAIWLGIATAVASYIGNFCTLRALGELPSHIVFPLIVGGPILVIAIWQHMVRKQRLSRSKAWGVALGLLAVICLTTTQR